MPQAVAKRIICHLSHTVICASNIIDPIITLFSPHEVRSYFHICYPSIVTFCIRCIYLGFSNTSRVESLDRFRISVSVKVKTEVCNKNKNKNNIFVQKLGMGDPTTCVYQFI